jgi:hypothetical protein
MKIQLDAEVLNGTEAVAVLDEVSERVANGESRGELETGEGLFELLGSEDA